MAWIESAKAEVQIQIAKLDLPFTVPDVRELILLWPQDLADLAGKVQ